MSLLRPSLCNHNSDDLKGNNSDDVNSNNSDDLKGNTLNIRQQRFIDVTF